MKRKLLSVATELGRLAEFKKSYTEFSLVSVYGASS
jgi:hypothetical protein